MMFRKTFILLTILGLIVSSCQKQESLLPSAEDVTSDEQTHQHQHEDKPFKLTDEQKAELSYDQAELDEAKKVEEKREKREKRRQRPGGRSRGRKSDDEKSGDDRTDGST